MIQMSDDGRERSGKEKMGGLAALERERGGLAGASALLQLCAVCPCLSLPQVELNLALSLSLSCLCLCSALKNLLRLTLLCHFSLISTPLLFSLSVLFLSFCLSLCVSSESPLFSSL